LGQAAYPIQHHQQDFGRGFLGKFLEDREEVHADILPRSGRAAVTSAALGSDRVAQGQTRLDPGQQATFHLPDPDPAGLKLATNLLAAVATAADQDARAALQFAEASVQLGLGQQGSSTRHPGLVPLLGLADID